MTHLPRYSLVVLAALVVAGCGGGSSSKGSPVSSPFKSAPTQVEYFDTDGTLVSRVHFEYPDELNIEAQVQTAGPDTLWDTEDDTTHPYLQCKYMYAPSPLLRYPDIYFSGMARTPTGAIELAQAGIPASGDPIKCPVRSGRRLLEESGKFGNAPPASPGDQYDYRITAEQEDLSGTVIERIAYDVGVDGIPPGFSELEPATIGDHYRFTTVIYDEEQRPIRVDLLSESAWNGVLEEYCAEGDTLAIHMILGRSCRSARETYFYRYFSDSVELDIQSYNVWSSAELFSTTSTRLSDSVIMYTGTVESGPTSASHYMSYPFNDAGQVTAAISHSNGDDNVWGTEDDQGIAFQTFHYGSHGKLSKITTPIQTVAHYEYNADGTLMRADNFDSTSDLPSQRVLFEYLEGSPARITVVGRSPDGEEGYVLNTYAVIEFAPSEEWSALFSPIALLLGSAPDIEDLMQIRP